MTFLRPLLAAVAAGGVFLAGFGPPAGATVCRRLDVNDLCALSAVVVEGEVREVSSNVDSSGRRVYTEVQIFVKETFKGAPLAMVKVRTPGGRVGPLVQYVCGAARFVRGEKVLLFLWKTAKGRLVPLGLSQGKLTKVRDRKGKVWFRSDLRGLTMVDPATGEPEKAASQSPVRKIEAKVLRKAVRTIVRRQKAEQEAREKAKAPKKEGGGK
jgi:hypothetical protein